MSRGILQFDMWREEGRSPPVMSGMWDWEEMRRRIAKHGVRNSLLVAPMPTASTSQLMGNSEGIEPYMCNLFKRTILCGEFTVINKHMVNDLMWVFVYFSFSLFHSAFSPLSSPSPSSHPPPPPHPPSSHSTASSLPLAGVSACGTKG